ncbi:MAG: pyridoxal-phosphate dependent enzyme [Treponema sp.]|nr:pyridoxal-phosphate dependent enzyme [Treponema sp.]
MVQFKCYVCGNAAPLDTRVSLCGCGGLYQLDFTPPEYKPALVDTAEWNIFRYRAFMPPLGEGWREVTLGEGMTATLEYREKLWFKLDYAMPTLSFKDRGAAALVWLCKTIGVENVVQDSSGNAGNSVAAYCARAGIGCQIFVPKGTSPSKIKMIEAHGAQCVVFDGSRDETADACRKMALTGGRYYANHVYNPMFYQGTKTFIYEVYEQLGRIPSNLFIPVGNGTLFLGCQIALNELRAAGCIDSLPRLFIVQSERCAPLYNAGDTPRGVVPEPTYAEGIAIGKPMRGKEILSNTAYAGQRVVITSPEAGILPAREELGRGGFHVEHTTAAVYAAYLAYTAEKGLEGDSLIPLCGAGLKSDK